METDKQENRESFFVDGHVDLPYFMMTHAEDAPFKHLEKGPYTLKKAQTAGIRLFCAALYCADRYNGEKSFSHFRDILNFTLKAFEDFPVLKEKKALTQWIKGNTPLGIVMLLENADLLADEPSHMDLLLENGIRMVGLTHAGQNRLADGNGVRFAEGLTRAGRDVVRALGRNSIIIDIAHLHEKCFWQVLDLTDHPVITSHTGIRSICNIPRNIDLYQAKKIYERNGIIGISFNPEMLSSDGEAEVDTVFAHIDTLVQKLGPDCIGIGSDFCGYDRETAGLKDITGIGNLVQILSAHGYGPDAVSGIMGLNWLRFYQNILGAYPS